LTDTGLMLIFVILIIPSERDIFINVQMMNVIEVQCVQSNVLVKWIMQYRPRSNDWLNWRYWTQLVWYKYCMKNMKWN